MDDPGKPGALGTQAAAAKPALEALELPAPGPVEFIVARWVPARAWSRTPLMKRRPSSRHETPWQCSCSLVAC